MRLAAKFSLCLLLFPLQVLASGLPDEEPRRVGTAPFVDDSARVRQVEGTVEALYADDFDEGGSELVYHLVTAEGERFPLTFPGGPARGYRTGEHLVIRGRMTDEGRLEVESAEASPRMSPETAGLETNAWSTGPKRVLLIRYNFKDDTSQPYSDATAQNVMFGAAGSVAAFYAEGSYGLTTQTGSITPWVTVSTNKPTTCDISAYTEATTLAKARGYDSANYDFTVYVFPHLPCGWAGLGVVGGSGAWINQALSTYVVGHELGHNYGLMHAHSRSCSGLSIGPSCTESEYGDPFDTMGGSLHQFNAFHKNQLAWLTGASVATRSSGSGSYTLMPLESGSGLRAVQLPTSDPSRTYWVEFRQAIGFDSSLSGNANVMNGVLIHIGPSADWGSDLLDMNPSTTTFGDAALDVGNAFTDATVGLTITAVSKSGATFNVQIDFVPVAPTASFSYFPGNPVAGQTVSFDDTSSGVPTSWNWAFGDGAVSTLQNPTHAYALPGPYTVTLTASNAVGASAPFSRTVTVGAPPKPIITGLAASPTLPQQAGTPITWTAMAVGGAAPLQYEFLLYTGSSTSWSVGRAYSASNTWTWTPSQAGQYAVQVWVKSNDSTAAYDAWRSSGFFNIAAAGGPLTITSLTANPALPQPPGATITWTAMATGGVPPLQYQFLLYTGSTGHWAVARAFSTSNTWSWTPLQAGQYAVQVWVKNSGSTASYDAWKGSGFFNIVTSGPPASISALTASPALPQKSGTQIVWTATASGGTAPLQYQFLLYTGSSGTWSIARAYSSSNTWTWTPSQAGQYVVQVWVKSNGSGAPYDAWKGSGFITITP
jgi:PKD repeat protein